MTEDVIFFDTGACMQGGHVGDANSVDISAVSPRTLQSTYTYAGNDEYGYRFRTTNDKGWWINTFGTPTQANYDSNGVPTTERTNAWDTRLSVNSDIKLYWEDLYKDLLTDYIDLIEDCDVECQKKGSQLTGIASLMGFIYGIVGLNALFMFIGTWRPNWRVCSAYCTLATCVCQLIVLIIVATMLMTPYNAICARSLYPSWGPSLPYYMTDDFNMTFTLWIASIFTMFIFCCIGHCQIYAHK